MSAFKYNDSYTNMYAFFNENKPSLMYIPDHHAPTIINQQSGVIAQNPTMAKMQTLTGSGYTGGYDGPATNALGIIDKGNWSGQINAGIPNQNTFFAPSGSVQKEDVAPDSPYFSPSVALRK